MDRFVHNAYNVFVEGAPLRITVTAMFGLIIK